MHARLFLGLVNSSCGQALARQEQSYFNHLGQRYGHAVVIIADNEPLIGDEVIPCLMEFLLVLSLKQRKLKHEDITSKEDLNGINTRSLAVFDSKKEKRRIDQLLSILHIAVLLYYLKTTMCMWHFI